jgi:hypothetical protein
MREVSAPGVHHAKEMFFFFVRECCAARFRATNFFRNSVW